MNNIMHLQSLYQMLAKKNYNMHVTRLTDFLFLLLCFLFLLSPSWNSNEALVKCKQRVELIANTLQLEGFSRIDAFVNADSGEVCWFPNLTGHIILPKRKNIEVP